MACSDSMICIGLALAEMDGGLVYVDVVVLPEHCTTILVHQWELMLNSLKVLRIPDVDPGRNQVIPFEGIWMGFALALMHMASYQSGFNSEDEGRCDGFHEMKN